VQSGAHDFEDFYEKTYRHLAAGLRHMVGDRTVVEEILGDAYAHALARWEQIENPYTWITAVVYRRATRHAPRQRMWQQRLAVLYPDARRAAVGDPVAIAEGREDYLRVCAALGALPPRQRAAAVMTWILDLPVEETARHMGCGPSTVYTHLERARAALHRKFGVGGEWLDSEPRHTEGDNPR